MIRRLRRAHPIVVSLIAAVTLAVAIAATVPRDVPSKPALPAQLSPPNYPSAVFAAAAWPIGRDTLYLELARSPTDTVGAFARFTASSGARWADALVMWSPDTTQRAAVGAVELGVVAAGHPLIVRLHRAGGTFYLHSVAWDSLLGSWRLPLVRLAAGPER